MFRQRKIEYFYSVKLAQQQTDIPIVIRYGLDSNYSCNRDTMAHEEGRNDNRSTPEADSMPCLSNAT